MKILKSKLFVLRFFLASLGVVMVSSGAIASVKWSLPPDTTPSGIDIRCDRNDSLPRTLADDFKCTSTGYITDVHFWGSWKGDIKGEMSRIHLSIHSDIPATQTSPSRPGALLWQKDFFALQGQITETFYYDLGNYWEGWWDPYQNILLTQGDHLIWRYDIKINKAEAFLQQGTATNPVIYWLDVYVVTSSNAQFGWKTSSKHWQDAAGYFTTSGGWQDMTYPIASNPYFGQPIDMAFELTTLPSPYIAIDDTAWQAALTDGSVSPVDEASWLDYMGQWEVYRESPTKSYPANVYSRPRSRP
jgi:hypothetical protein